jgi:hypothetical protein
MVSPVSSAGSLVCDSLAVPTVSFDFWTFFGAHLLEFLEFELFSFSDGEDFIL